jgi:signal transduction histidine kinase
MNRKIQNRIIYLIAAVGVLLTAGLLISRQAERIKIDHLLDGELHRNGEQLNLIIDFKSKNLRDFATDYTYWDDMVQFTRSRDLKWASDNIQVSMSTFDIDYAWVYDKNLALLYGTSQDNDESIENMPLQTKQISLLVDTARIYNFFINTEAGLLEISGGSIHPTNDPERKTNPEGYLFVGRLWSPEYISEIEQFSGTRITVISMPQKAFPNDSIYPKAFSFVNFKPIEGWNHVTFAYLRSSGHMDIAREFRDQSVKSQILLAIVQFVLLILFSGILIRMVNYPLHELTSALVAGTSESISRLMDSNSEFGRLAQLIVDFFKQKKVLESEIQERIQIEKELIVARDRAEESDRLKTAFLNNISHEIRTPMNAIVGFSELLANQKISDAERNEFVGIIRDSSNRLLAVITDLINISTIQSGQEVVKEEQFNLNELLYEVYAEILPDINTDKVSFSLDAALRDDHSMIFSDRTKLEHILLNLIRNAAKFTSEGEIIVGYSVRSSDIEFFIKDTGIGIPEDKMSTIFARFEQIDDKLSRKYGGTGLGLPISKAYVELLGGRIWFTSKSGLGSEFCFSIPFKPI